MHDTVIEGAQGMGAWARDFIATLKPEHGRACVVALSGDLGAGKTTLAQGIARALGVQEIVISPTFVIEKIYQLHPGSQWRRLVHIDAYRLKDASELHAIGWDEVVADKDTIVLVEWPERIHVAIPPHTIRLTLSGSGNSRTITKETQV